MPRTLLYICIAATACSTAPLADLEQEEFEGIIRYKITVRSKSEVMTSDQFQADFGRELTFYYKQGQCRMSFGGEDLQEVWYNPTNLTEYTLRKGIDSLFTGKVDTVLAELEYVDENDGEETLLGLSCNCVSIETNKYTRRLCYSPSLYLDPTHFAKYTAANYDRYYAIAHSPFLKQEYIGKSFEYTYTVAAIEPGPLDDSLFELPHLPLTKFPKQ